MRTCVICGEPVAADEKRCTACGFPAEEMRFFSAEHCRTWMKETVEPYRRTYSSQSGIRALREEVAQLREQSEILQQALLKAYRQSEALQREISVLRERTGQCEQMRQSLYALYTLSHGTKWELGHVTLEEGQTEYTVKAGVQAIGDETFADCFGLERVTMPDSVIHIGSNAFLRCHFLTDMTIPQGVLGIGNGAFCECSRLAHVTMPDSVIRIGEGAFQKCESLTQIVIPRNVVYIEDDTFSDCGKLKRVILPDGIVRIGEGAFYSCESLEEIRIPRGVSVIGTWAFAWCGALTRIVLPDTIKTIEDKAFSGVKATVYYPKHCAGAPWVGQSYRGNLTWVAM